MFGFGIRNLVSISKTVISRRPVACLKPSYNHNHHPQRTITMATSSRKYKVVNTPTIYFGTFIHSPRDEASKLDVCEEGAIGVNSDGVIDFVERDVKDIDSIVDKYPSFKNAEIVQTRPEGTQFFFPGFIGMSLSLVSPREPLGYCLLTALSPRRYSHSRSTISKCRCFWIFYPSRLVEQIHLPEGGLPFITLRRSNDIFPLCRPYPIPWDYDGSILCHDPCPSDQPPS